MKEAEFTERITELDRDGYKAYRIADGTDEASTRVIRGVNEIIGRDAETQMWLYNSIDPDALDSIFESKYDGTTRPEGTIVFTARGCEIEVHASGEIIVFVPEIDDENE